MAEQGNNPFDLIYQTMITNRDSLEFPLEVHVELTNVCNLRCFFCPTGKISTKRLHGRMREDLFWGICTEAFDNGAAIRLVRWGEPTLHVRCYDYIKMAKSIGLKVHMNTNGVNMDVMATLDSGLDSLKVSLHSLEAVKSVNRLIRTRDSLGLNHPFVTVAQLSPQETGRGLISITADRFTTSDIKDLTEGNRCPDTCWELYNRLSVDWDGTVVACCGAYDRQMELGHIYDKNTLKDIWDGETLKYYREMEQNHTLKEVELCNHCAR